jgi:transposase InsO family protein
LPQDKGERSVIAGNVLDRGFTAAAPNQKWVADFTYIWTAQGWLYVAVSLDLYSRRIVGWSMQDSMTSQLVVDVNVNDGCEQARADVFDLLIERFYNSRRRRSALRYVSPIQFENTQEA